ncbi:MAG: hypothetical protein WBF53_06755 [Litorimonas sp.]
MNEKFAHPGKLRGIYLRSFQIFIVVASAAYLSIMYVGHSDARLIISFTYPLSIFSVYFGLRVGNAYAVQTKWRYSKSDVWAWPIFFFTYLVIPPFAQIGEESAGDTLIILNLAAQMIAIVPFVVAYHSGGRKLAWLAGDQIGGRSTFLRFTQLFYSLLTFNYIGLHTREPKRPFKADRP